MAEQATDFLDMMEFLYPEMQVHCQFDWYVACTHTRISLLVTLHRYRSDIAGAGGVRSSGHSKRSDDGLATGGMNWSYGGKHWQKMSMRSSQLTAECIGPHPALITTTENTAW